MSTTCPNCHAAVTRDAQFCDTCGANLKQPVYGDVAPTLIASDALSGSAADGGVVCPSCNTSNIAGAVFCEHCGTPLTAAGGALGDTMIDPGAGADGPVGPSASAPGPARPVAIGAPAQTPAGPPPAAAASASGVGDPRPAAARMGRFVVQATGASLPIPTGKAEMLIGREDPISGIFPEVDLDAYNGLDNGVGRRHARLTVQGGQIYLEDLDSVNKTRHNGATLSPKQKVPLADGDEIILGRLKLVYHSS